MTDIGEKLKIQILHAEYDGSYFMKQHAVLLREAKAEIERWRDRANALQDDLAESDKIIDDFGKVTPQQYRRELGEAKAEIERLGNEIAEWKRVASVEAGLRRDFLSLCDKRQTEIERLRAASPDGWQPIDSAPRDGTEILTISKSGIRVTRYDPMAYPSKNNPIWKWFIGMEDKSPIGGGAGTYCHPTHWRPLPDPPAQPQTGES
jgi:hypothetical protein